MRFPANIRAEKEGGYYIVFPDIPEAISCGRDIPDALYHGSNCLESAFEFYIESFRAVPTPSRLKKGQYLLDIPVSLTLKILLLNAMVEKGVRPAALARKMKLRTEEVMRLLLPRYKAKLDAIADALHLLGKNLEFSVVPALAIQPRKLPK